MPTPRVKFNWSTLDRETIADFVLLLAPQLVKVEVSISQFHSILTNHLKKLAPIRFKKTVSCKVEPNHVWVGGTYHSDWDQEKRKCIELMLVYPLFEEDICISKRRFTAMSYTIADTLLHEIIHMRQYRRRNFKVIPDYASTAEKSERRIEQSYLGCSDEIDAYSFNIACELYDKFHGDFDVVIQYLNENQKGTNRRHNSWRMYLTAFQHDHNHKIIKRVKQKVVRYLPFAELGKPYKNKDWINR